jgi:hypothetical protein
MTCRDCKEYCTEVCPHNVSVIADSGGNVWRNWCWVCHKPTMSVVCVGKIQCKICGR